MQDRTGQAESLSHAGGIRANRIAAARFEPDPSEQLSCRLDAVAQTPEFGKELYMLDSGERPVESEVGRDHTDQRTSVQGIQKTFLEPYLDVACFWLQ